MGPNMGPGPPGGPPANMRFPQMAGNPRMGGRGQGFQSIPPSGPMMRQQPPNMMGNGDMQRMRFQPNPGMMGPGVPNGPQKVPVSHPSPQPHAGSPWSNNMGSPNPNGMQMQQQSVGSPRTPGRLRLINKLVYNYLLSILFWRRPKSWITNDATKYAISNACYECTK